ncbi:MAG: Bifunctional ligase/repressor BirA [Candidatus Heimdallarchaeota archaeon AB_125]|nr:MAG: Bifunctional ligase/repressor BirA [Candidatus Heimdallarchaeota archaeon AB_125]
MVYRIEYMNTVHYETTSSTMDVILKHLESELDNPILIIAKKQTKGRGRRDSEWFSPTGGLYMTYAFPLLTKPHLHQIRFLHYAAALGVQQVLRKSFSDDVLVKWPNDIYFEKKKLGGILIELVTKNLEYLLLGVGINIVRKDEGSEESKKLDIAFLEDIIQDEIELDKLIKHFSESIFKFVNLTFSIDYKKLTSIYNKNMINMNRKHKFESRAFTCKGISENGMLRLESTDSSHFDIPIDQSTDLTILY